MSRAFEVRYTETARDDLLRLLDFLYDRARTAEALDAAKAAIDAIELAIERLRETPFIYRKASSSNPFLRELIIAYRSAGCVALYEIAANHVVNVLAIRHQLEDDYH